MESFSRLCYQEIPEAKGICICCTSQTEFLINLSTCRHSSFLVNYINLKLTDKMHICALCHHMLKKIEMFKQQVNDSIAFITDQYQILKITKLHDLQYIHDTNIDTTRTENDIKELPNDIITSEQSIFKTEIKIEQDTTDYEDEVPLHEIKSSKKRRRVIEKHDGKIQTITLTEQELEEERERCRNQEGYKKLPFKCESCILGFDHEGSLKRHISSRHKKINSDLKCHICQSVLGSKMSYNQHTRRHLRRHECMRCGRRYNHIRSAIQHYDEVHAAPGASIQSPYTCQECGFDTKSHRVFRYHMDKHKKKPVCKHCGNSFVNASGLRVHMYTVHKQSQRLYQCTECDKSYTAKSGLFAHTRSIHAASSSRAFCTECNVQYRSEQVLKHHLRTHSNHITEDNKKFICDDCGTKFVLKHSLRTHIQWTHMRNVAHRCDKCSKLFKSGSQLRKHVKFVHEKKRPPRDKICDYCGRAFTTQAILQSHIRTHTGEKPHHCTYCSARFAHSAALYTHKKLLHNTLDKS